MLLYPCFLRSAEQNLTQHSFPFLYAWRLRATLQPKGSATQPVSCSAQLGRAITYKPRPTKNVKELAQGLPRLNYEFDCAGLRVDSYGKCMLMWMMLPESETDVLRTT